MIVVVEGPSAAGKTSWTVRHCDPAVIVAETSNASRSEWTTALEASRPAFAEGQLGLADLMLVTIPDRDTLIRRRARDTSRRRRGFDLHIQLGAALAEWYHAIEQLDPGRVIWHLPAEGLPGKLSLREPRSGIQLLDTLLELLPAT